MARRGRLPCIWHARTVLPIVQALQQGFFCRGEPRLLPHVADNGRVLVTRMCKLGYSRLPYTATVIDFFRYQLDPADSFYQYARPGCHGRVVTA